VPLERVRLAMGDTDLCPYDMVPSAVVPCRRRESAQLCRRVRPLPVAGPVGTRRVEIVTGEPAVTAPSNWRIAGTAHIPTRTLDAVTGGLRFVTDLSMPGLRHGAMLRAPVLDSKLVHLRTDALDSIGDVVVARTSSGIGVVAGDRVQVRAALACLEATWDIPGAPSDDDLDEFLRSHPLAGDEGWSGPFHFEQGDPSAALDAATVRVDASYSTAFVARSLETRVALAVWDDHGRLTVWTGTQTLSWSGPRSPQPWSGRAGCPRDRPTDRRRIRWQARGVSRQRRRNSLGRWVARSGSLGPA